MEAALATRVDPGAAAAGAVQVLVSNTVTLRSATTYTRKSLAAAAVVVAPEVAVALAAMVAHPAVVHSGSLYSTLSQLTPSPHYGTTSSNVALVARAATAARVVRVAVVPLASLPAPSAQTTEKAYSPAPIQGVAVVMGERAAMAPAVVEGVVACLPAST